MTDEIYITDKYGRHLWDRERAVRNIKRAKNQVIIRNRKEALKNGDSLYKGSDCKYGHGNIRYIFGNCIVCADRSGRGLDLNAAQKENEIKKILDRKQEDDFLDSQTKEVWDE